MGGHASLSNGQHAGTSSSPKSPRVANNDEGSFGIEYEAGCRSSSTFRLMQVKGLPQWANKGCVNIRGVIQVQKLGLCWSRTIIIQIVNLSCAYSIEQCVWDSAYLSLFPSLVPSQICVSFCSVHVGRCSGSLIIQLHGGYRLAT